jgi:hypothetical protein
VNAGDDSRNPNWEPPEPLPLMSARSMTNVLTRRIATGVVLQEQAHLAEPALIAFAAILGASGRGRLHVGGGGALHRDQRRRCSVTTA